MLFVSIIWQYLIENYILYGTILVPTDWGPRTLDNFAQVHGWYWEQENTQMCPLPLMLAGGKTGGKLLCINLRCSPRGKRHSDHLWSLHVAAFSFYELGMLLLSFSLHSTGTCTSNLSSQMIPEDVSGRTLSLEFVSPVWFTEPELVWSPRAGVSSSSLGLHERGVRKESWHVLGRNLHILKGILYPCWNSFNGPQIRKTKEKNPTNDENHT